MRKRVFSALICLLLAVSTVSCGKAKETGKPNASGAENDTEEVFSDSDRNDVTAEEPNAEIALSGGEGTISDTARGSSGKVVTVTSKGIYRVTGSSEDVTVDIVDMKESGNVYLILDGVTMKNGTAPCIRVSKADKVIIETVGENTLTFTNADAGASEDAAIYASDDLTLFGKGSLDITSSLHGVVCKNDLKITGGTVNVEAAQIGLKAGDSVRVGGGETAVKAQHDGVRIKNKEQSGYFLIESGSLTVDAGYDGISADLGVSISDGAVKVTAGGGSERSKDKDVSQKGFKCVEMAVSGGAVEVSAADDAVNCVDLAVSGGNTTLSSSDDGVHADRAISVSGGDLSITKSYEGLESASIAVAGGKISVFASDDGLNAAGGKDTSDGDSDRREKSSPIGAVSIGGGELYVNANGDGIDSNGSIAVSGGTVIIEGPTDDGNGALDKGDGMGCVADITGGTVLALGSAGKAINFDSGTQCSALVKISGEAGDKIGVDDGNGLTFTATKPFTCAVYSSPEMKRGKTYTISAGQNTATIDLSKGIYYSDLPVG